MPKKPPRPKKVTAKKEEVGYAARIAAVQAREMLVSDVDFKHVFVITKDEQKRIAAWVKEQDAKVVHMQQQSGQFKGNAYAQKLHQRGKGYYGASGGSLRFCFTPTGLGLVFKVTNALTQETLDLTEYDSM